MTALLGFKLLPLPFAVLAWAGGLAVLITLTGLALGLRQSADLLRTARWVDDHHRLQERLSTAWEMTQRDASDRWRDLVVTDAADRLRDFDPRQALPFGLPRLARWCVLVLALGAGLGFVPEYRTEAFRQKQKEGVAIQETGRQLEQLVKRELETRPPALETTRSALEAVQELGQRLGKMQLTRQEALKDLASVTDRLEQQLRELGRDPALRRLDEGSRAGPDGEARTPEGLRQQMEALQRELGRQADQSDGLERLMQELQDIQSAAAGLADANGSQAEALRQQMSQALADLGKQAEEMGLDLAGLDEAMEALAQGQVDQLLKDLDAAFLDLDKLAQMAKAMQDLKSQLAELGKDLTEQLEKGQGLAAYATLKKMIQQLEQADLDPAQLEKILAEVEKAVPIGSEYGPLGEFLKQGARSLREGRKAQASQALAQAAEELKRLMEQAGDCEGMMAALEGLKMGQMCIGNGTGWGLCRGGSIGFKPGGKPGRGVGTWGDDGLMMEASDTGLWDNSGVERPDLESRGFTDRGEGQLNEALTPTKVRGQVSPGGPMPSITLRGVSIRGQSRVDFQEQVVSAQTDAQSALNQDRVPRAYRGAVRDYFDDLK